MIILSLGDDPCVSATAERFDVDRGTVRYWRNRDVTKGRRGLQGAPRPGRPVEIDPVSRCELVAMACGKPSDFGIEDRAVWTKASLLDAYRERAPEFHPLSRTSVLRILNHADIKPHRKKMWLHSPDPKFREKVTEICDLYLNAPLGSTVVCVDEKSGMQALGRKHPDRPPAPGREARRDYEYVRNGTRTLIAAFNPHTAEVFGQVRGSRKATDILDFMEALARQIPEGEVHVIWDNLNIHHNGKSNRWDEFTRRHGGRFHFHYTPVHASWVNQVEIFFGILHRRVLKYGVFGSTGELDKAVLAFLNRWNVVERHPFRWKFKGYPLQTDLEQAAA